MRFARSVLHVQAPQTPSLMNRHDRDWNTSAPIASFRGHRTAFVCQSTAPAEVEVSMSIGHGGPSTAGGGVWEKGSIHGTINQLL